MASIRSRVGGEMEDRYLFKAKNRCQCIEDDKGVNLYVELGR